jgi:hypothetical protein
MGLLPNTQCEMDNWRFLVSEESGEVEVGFAAPEFKRLASTGGEIGLKDYQDKSHVVLFFVREYG